MKQRYLHMTTGRLRRGRRGWCFEDVVRRCRFKKSGRRRGVIVLKYEWMLWVELGLDGARRRKPAHPSATHKKACCENENHNS